MLECWVLLRAELGGRARRAVDLLQEDHLLGPHELDEGGLLAAAPSAARAHEGAGVPADEGGGQRR
eukprot:7967536-Pyramimonas_sp.AAC.1